MKKKAIVILLTLSIAAAGIVGCGKQTSAENTGAAAQETPAVQASESKEAAEEGTSSGTVKSSL